MDTPTRLKARWQHEATERARYLQALADIRDDEAAALVCLGITEQKMSELLDEYLAQQEAT